MFDTLVCLSHCVIIASSVRYDLSHFIGKEAKYHKKWGNVLGHTANKRSWNYVFSPTKFITKKNFCLKNVELGLVIVVYYNLFAIWDCVLLYIIFPICTNSFFGYKGIQ